MRASPPCFTLTRERRDATNYTNYSCCSPCPKTGRQPSSPIPSQGTRSSAACTGTRSSWAAGSHRHQLAQCPPLICSCLISINWLFSVCPILPARTATGLPPCLLWGLTCGKGGSSGAEDREGPAVQRTEFNIQKYVCPTLLLLLHPKSLLS